MGRKRKTQDPVVTESIEDKAKTYGLRSFVVDPISNTFDWASDEVANGTRGDRLIAAMAIEFAALRPVVLGVLLPTWIPITRNAFTRFDAREIHYAGLVDLNTVFMGLQDRVEGLRVFTHWQTFVEARGPKLYVWEAFRPKQPADRDLAAVLKSFVTATATEHDVTLATDGVLSLVGALLLRDRLTDDVTMLHSPCVLVGQPQPNIGELRRDQKRRDQELIDFLVKQAIGSCFEKNGHPALAKLCSSELPSEDSPPPKRRRKPPGAQSGGPPGD